MQIPYPDMQMDKDNLDTQFFGGTRASSVFNIYVWFL